MYHAFDLYNNGQISQLLDNVNHIQYTQCLIIDIHACKAK